MARRLLLSCLLLLCGVIASCSDSTAPAGGVRITVSPDTMHVVEGQAMTLLYRISSASELKVWPSTPDLEIEATGGDWRAVVDSTAQYLQAALGDATSTADNGEIVGVRRVTIGPGRYRLRLKFQLSALNATQPAGEVSMATSNVFVVVSP